MLSGQHQQKYNTRVPVTPQQRLISSKIPKEKEQVFLDFACWALILPLQGLMCSHFNVIINTSEYRFRLKIMQMMLYLTFKLLEYSGAFSALYFLFNALQIQII